MFPNAASSFYNGMSPGVGRLFSSRRPPPPSPMKNIQPPPAVPAEAGPVRNLAMQAHQENATAAAPGLNPQVAKVARLLESTAVKSAWQAYEEKNKAKVANDPMTMQPQPADPQMGPMSTAISAPPAQAQAGGGATPPAMAGSAAGAPPPAAGGAPVAPATPPAAPQTLMPPQPMLPPSPVDPRIAMSSQQLMGDAAMPEPSSEMRFDRMVTANAKDDFCKSAWQINTKGDRTSATGEGRSAGFDHRDDDYDKGPKAWGNVGKYLHHPPAQQPDPFKGIHKSARLITHADLRSISHNMGIRDPQHAKRALALYVSQQDEHNPNMADCVTKTAALKGTEKFHHDLAVALKQPSAAQAAIARSKNAGVLKAAFNLSPAIRKLLGGVGDYALPAAAGIGSYNLARNQGVDPVSSGFLGLAGASVASPRDYGKAIRTGFSAAKQEGISPSSGMLKELLPMAKRKAGFAGLALVPAAATQGIKAVNNLGSASGSVANMGKSLENTAATVQQATPAIASNLGEAAKNLNTSSQNTGGIFGPAGERMSNAIAGTAEGVNNFFSQHGKQLAIGAGVGIPAALALRALLRTKKKPSFGGPAGQRPRSTKITLRQPGDYRISVDEDEQNALSSSAEKPVMRKAAAYDNSSRGSGRIIAAADDSTRLSRLRARRGPNDRLVQSGYLNDKSSADLAVTAKHLGLWGGKPATAPAPAPPKPGNIGTSLGKAAANAQRKRQIPAVSPEELEPYVNKKTAYMRNHNGL